ncbi:hypothetical protein [Streptomyces sp. MB09-01]|uniref:hypothetical protein n=1 Tax=Streptomyces sp. MB09-01 TaxID=3028666 RepID=UPI0029CA46B1|nr:hypothetical protein [Streptomyces sp. MB09-01]
MEPGFETELLEAWWREAARLDPRIPGPDPAGPDRTGPGAGGPPGPGPAAGRLASRPLAGDRVRRALHALTRTRFFGAVSDRLLISDLKQVRRYFTEPELRAAVRARAAELITPGTRVVVGHSLGSVVAYEALCALGPDRPPLSLVTLGSPLGLAGLVATACSPHRGRTVRGSGRPLSRSGPTRPTGVTRSPSSANSRPGSGLRSGTCPWTTAPRCTACAPT